MSDAKNEAFELAVASVSTETDKLTEEVIALLREAIVNDWPLAEIISRLFP